jgi:uncharacterized Ntn-hydrolase superfamily protein
MLAIRPSYRPVFLLLLAPFAVAQEPPKPQPPQPGQPAQPNPSGQVGDTVTSPTVGPPAAADANAKTVAPEDRPEFDYKATSTEHPYVEIAGLVARDARTGDLGVIVLSTSPGVGALCVQAKAEAGIAVVSGNTDPLWAGQAIDLLGTKLFPAEVVATLKTEATQSVRDRQQVVVLGADGKIASHIGDYVFGGGKTSEVSEGPEWAAFTTYAATPALFAGLQAEYPKTDGLPLPERLLISMQRALDPLPVDKGKRADLTGRAVSAALLVVRKDGGRLGRGDRLIDVRVDFDQDPMARLRGLYKVWTQAHLGPALRTSLSRITDQQSEAYRADQDWMRRLRARTKLGEKR